MGKHCLKYVKKNVEHGSEDFFLENNTFVFVLRFCCYHFSVQFRSVSTDAICSDLNYL
jgi:hypothetical protein